MRNLLQQSTAPLLSVVQRAIHSCHGVAAVLVPLSLGACQTPPTSPPTFESASKSVSRSIAPIICRTGLGVDGPRVATGVFVESDGSFVTAKHVIEELRIDVSERKCVGGGVYVPKADWVTFPRDVRWWAFDVSACVLHPQLDLALCRVAEKNDIDTMMRPARLRDDLLAQGAPVAVLGFPMQLDVPVLSVGAVAAYAGFSKQSPPVELVMDQNTWHGQSGGPVFSLAGQIVGVQGGHVEGANAGLSYAVPAWAITAFIHDAKPKLAR